MMYESKTSEYEIIKKLGEGANGITYLVKSNNKEFVLKELKLSNTEDWKTIDRFKKEIKNLKNLNHPNIPKYIDIIESDKIIAYVQEYIKGVSLQNMIENEIPISPEVLLSYIKQGLNILNYIHNLTPPLIHRDISPKNIIVNGSNLYIIDLGIALNYNENNTITTAGTFGYMAPEQIIGQPTPQSDIYSFGITIASVINQVDVDKLPLKDNGKIDIEKSLSFLPKRIKTLLTSMTQKGTAKRLENAKKGIEYLNNKIGRLNFENDQISKNKKLNIKKFIKFKYFFILFLVSILAYTTIRYNKLTEVNKKRVKVFGSFTKGHTSVISLITGILFNDYNLIISGGYINFVTTLQNDKYLLSIGKRIILWDFKTKKIIWNIEAPYNLYNAKIYFNEKEDIAYLSNYFNLKLYIKDGKLDEVNKKEINSSKNLKLYTKHSDNKYQDLMNKDRKIKDIIYSINENRNEIIIIKKNYYYLFDKEKEKYICKIRNPLGITFNLKIELSIVPKGLWAIKNEDKVTIYNSKCKKINTIPVLRYGVEIKFSDNEKYLIVGERTGLISVWKTKNKQ